MGNTLSEIDKLEEDLLESKNHEMYSLLVNRDMEGIDKVLKTDTWDNDWIVHCHNNNLYDLIDYFKQRGYYENETDTFLK